MECADSALTRCASSFKRGVPGIVREMMAFSPPSGIRIGDYLFSEPQPWHQAAPPKGGGLYALLAPDPAGVMDYRLVSVGEGDNLRAAFFKQGGGPLMQLAFQHQAQIHVGWLPMPFSTPDQRRSAKAEIINGFLPELRTYKLFLSHSWGHSDEYNKLVALLDKAYLRFRWEDVSITVGAPVLPNPILKRSYRSVLKKVETRIVQADCVLVLAGMYGSWSPWIQSEVESAQDNRKPIIGVEPHGQQRVPEEVRNAALEMVGWRSESIVAAIRRAVSAAR
jgi:MTH538 TIR-like domain (DUF1863)